MADNYVPKFEDTIDHPTEVAPIPPKFEDTVDHPTFTPTPDDEYGTRGMQRKAIGLGAQVGEHLLPFGIIPKAVAGVQTLGNDKSYAQNKQDVRDQLDKTEEPAGLIGTAAGVGTEFATGTGEFNMIKNAMGLGKGASEGSSILNAIARSKMTPSERLLDAGKRIGGSAAEGAAVMGTGGALESDHPDEILPNAFKGAKTGAEIGAATGTLGHLFENTGIAKKFGKAFNMGTENEANYGIPSNIKTGNTVINTADQVSDQMLQPLEASGKLYGEELQRAARLGNTVPPTTGLQTASQNVFQDIPSDKIKDFHQKLLNGSLNPVEAKAYQNVVNEYLKKPSLSVLEQERLQTLRQALNTGIDSTLPPDRLAKINKIYQGSRQGLETYLNDGIQNPKAQLESVSDYNPSELKANIVRKIAGDTIPNAMRVNPSSSAPVQTSLANYMDSANKQETGLNKIIQDIADEESTGKGAVAIGSKNNLKDVYGNTKIDYNAPDSIRQIEDAGTRMAVTGTTGSHYHGENGPVTKLGTMAINPQAGAASALASSPYKVANMAGRAASPYRAVADRLMNSPFKVIGQAMHDQLDNPTANGMNALMMKIMQSADMKKAIGINDNGSNIPGVVNSDKEK